MWFSFYNGLADLIGSFDMIIEKLVQTLKHPIEDKYHTRRNNDSTFEIKQNNIPNTQFVNHKVLIMKTNYKKTKTSPMQTYDTTSKYGNLCIFI